MITFDVVIQQHDFACDSSLSSLHADVKLYFYVCIEQAQTNKNVYKLQCEVGADSVSGASHFQGMGGDAMGHWDIQLYFFFILIQLWRHFYY